MVSFSAFSVPIFAEENSPDDTIVASETANTENPDVQEEDDAVTPDVTPSDSADTGETKESDQTEDSDKTEDVSPEPEKTEDITGPVTDGQEKDESSDPETTVEAEEEDPAIGEETNSDSDETEKGKEDLSAVRVVAAISDPSAVDEKTVISEYNGMYILGYDSLESANTAVADFNAKGFFAALDTTVYVNEGDVTPEEEVISNTEVTSDSNPLNELETAVSEAENVVPQNDARKLIAVIDTGTTKDGVASVSMLGDEGIDKNGHGDKMIDYIYGETLNVDIISIKALGDDGKGDISAVYAAINYAIEAKADIINMSFNAFSTEENAILKEAILRATEAGITVVVSAGNNNTDAKYFTPSNIAEAYVIGGADAEQNKNETSNYGESVDYYVVAESTSEAAARFTGIAAKYGITHADTHKDVYSNVTYEGNPNNPTREDNEFNVNLPDMSIVNHGTKNAAELVNADMAPGNMDLTLAVRYSEGEEILPYPTELGDSWKFDGVKVTDRLEFTYADWFHVQVGKTVKTVSAKVTLYDFKYYLNQAGTSLGTIIKTVHVNKNFKGGWLVRTDEEGSLAYDCKIEFFVDGQPYELPRTDAVFRSLNIGEFARALDYYASEDGGIYYYSPTGRDEDIKTSTKVNATFNDFVFENAGINHNGAGVNGTNGWGTDGWQ